MFATSCRTGQKMFRFHCNGVYYSSYCLHCGRRVSPFSNVVAGERCFLDYNGFARRVDLYASRVTGNTQRFSSLMKMRELSCMKQLDCLFNTRMYTYNHFSFFLSSLSLDRMISKRTKIAIRSVHVSVFNIILREHTNKQLECICHMIFDTSRGLLNNHLSVHNDVCREHDQATIQTDIDQ